MATWLPVSPTLSQHFYRLIIIHLQLALWKSSTSISQLIYGTFLRFAYKKSKLWESAIYNWKVVEKCGIYSWVKSRTNCRRGFCGARRIFEDCYWCAEREAVRTIWWSLLCAIMRAGFVASEAEKSWNIVLDVRLNVYELPQIPPLLDTVLSFHPEISLSATSELINAFTRYSLGCFVWIDVNEKNN